MISLSSLQECVSASWSPVIGDPSVIGWVTVAAYGGTALLCAIAFWRAPDRVVRVFGVALAMLLLALMVNKQLDLQSALTATGRCIAKMQGWYEDRQRVQLGFILVLLMVSVVLGVGAIWLMRRHLSSLWLALLGLVCLLAFVAVRAVGFHHFDAVLNFRIQNVRMNWILELGGIAMIALNAFWMLIRGGRHRARDNASTPPDRWGGG